MTYRYYGPCLCAATDCPSCGPAQGYTVVKRWVRGRWRHVNPEDDEEEEDEEVDDAPDEKELNDERNYP